MVVCCCFAVRVALCCGGVCLVALLCVAVRRLFAIVRVLFVVVRYGMSIVGCCFLVECCLSWYVVCGLCLFMCGVVTVALNVYVAVCCLVGCNC